MRVHHHLREVGDFHDDRAGIVHRAGDDHFAFFRFAPRDDTIDRCFDRAIGQIIPSPSDIRLGGLELMVHDCEVHAIRFQLCDGRCDRGLQVVHFCLRCVDNGLADIFGFEQAHLPLQVALGIGEHEILRVNLSLARVKPALGDVNL